MQLGWCRCTQTPTLLHQEAGAGPPTEWRQAAAAAHAHLPVGPAREGRGRLQLRRLGDDGLHALAQRPAAAGRLLLPGCDLLGRRPAGGQTLPRRWHRHAWPPAAQGGLLLHRLLHTGRAVGKPGRATPAPLVAGSNRLWRPAERN